MDKEKDMTLQVLSNLENELVSAIPSEATTIITIFTRQKLGIINGVKATVEAAAPVENATVVPVEEAKECLGRQARIAGVKWGDEGTIYKKYLTEYIAAAKRFQKETGYTIPNRRFSGNKFRENFNKQNRVDITAAMHSKLLTITNGYNCKSWQDWGIVELLGEWVHMNGNEDHIERYFKYCKKKGYTPWQQ